ncbi:hypothetical protein AKJ55_01770 [candidate division MSBL1 archaeon SCGC-AAA382M17]|uniref:CARDB domain-containing protein n=1 Tax=candidate division MSBL1 archaeon SCGC-AAA382M17 TaxID=1698284 RepID=A0ABR5TLN0_9EURY|nr:hypothetical protein AKJ55_01770 [candidate division MSBL1 archaeon SCGC-AAA382M17]
MFQNKGFSAFRVVLLILVVGVLSGGIIYLGSIRSTPKFQVSNLEVSSSQVMVGEKVNISARIRNIGGTKGIYKAELKINGTITKTDDISLDSGANGIISLVWTPTDNGTFVLNVGNQTAELRSYLKFPFKNANSKYKLTWLSQDKTPVFAKVAYKVMIVEEDYYYVSMVPKMMVGHPTTPSLIPGQKSLEKDEPFLCTKTVNNGEFVGTESMPTSLGMMKLSHYHLENIRKMGARKIKDNTDAYLEKETGFPVIYVWSMEMPAENFRATLVWELIDTNFNYLETKMEKYG